MRLRKGPQFTLLKHVIVKKKIWPCYLKLANENVIEFLSEMEIHKSTFP